MLCLAGTMLSSCKDDDTANELSANTWTLTPEGKDRGSYRLKTITLSTDTYQLITATSEENSYGGAMGIESTLRIYVSTIGPPPTGTYQITSFDNLSKIPNSATVYLQTLGDPNTGLTTTSWYSQADSGKSLSITFANGKISASFTDVAVKQSGSGPQNGKVSATISQ